MADTAAAFPVAASLLPGASLGHALASARHALSRLALRLLTFDGSGCHARARQARSGAQALLLAAAGLAARAHPHTLVHSRA